MRFGAIALFSTAVVFHLLLVVMCEFSFACSPVYAAPGDRGDLEARLEKARESNDLSQQASLLYQLGVSEFNDGNVSRAETLVRSALSIDDTLKAKPEKGSKFIPGVHTRCALALILVRQGRHQEAVALYKEALGKALEAREETEAAKICKQLAAVELKLDKSAEAEETYHRAIELSRKSNCTDCEIASLTELGTLKREQNKLAESLQILDQALARAGDTAEEMTYARAVTEKARTLTDMGFQREALKLFIEAAKSYQAAGDPRLFAQSLVDIGDLQVGLRESAKAEKNLAKALELLEQENDVQYRIWCLTALGSARADLGKFATARENHELASRLAKKSGRIQDLLSAQGELGYDYFLEGSPEKALKQFLLVQETASKLENLSAEAKARILRDCGMGYRAVGQIAAAVKLYQDSASAYGEAGQPLQKILMLDSLAVAFLDQGDLTRFGEFHKQASELFSSYRSSGNISSSAKNGSDTPGDAKPGDGESAVNRELAYTSAVLSYNQGQFNLFSGKAEAAIRSFGKALKEFETVSDKVGQCQVLKGLGLAHLILDEPREAAESFQQALVLAEAIGNIESQWDCSTGLGKSYKKLKDYARAETELRKAVALADRERRQFSRDSFKTASLSLREGCFLDLIDLLVENGKDGEALEIAEKGRARAFLDMLEGRSTGAAINHVASISEDLLERGAGKTSKPLAIAMADTGTGSTQSQLRAVSVTARTSGLVEASAISPVNAKAPDITEIASLVKANGSYILEYVVMADKVIVWAIKPDGQIAGTRKIDIAVDQLKELIRESYISIVSSPKGVAELHKLNQDRQEKLRRLYDLLIGPVASLIPSDPEQTISIVPYGALYQVPFSALISPSNRFLVEEHTLAYLPAIGVLRATGRLKEDASERSQSLLAFGNPITEENKFLGQLPYAEKEVHKVASLFESRKVDVEVGRSATKSSFKRSAPDYTYIHLATHGLINQSRPMDSAVVLAPEPGDDGLLTVKDILELPRLKAELVVLSACQTGKGKITGDGVVGLSRAFVIAGTPSVMVSLWNVDDVMTEYQMESMYSALLHGASKASALRKAQLATISFMEKGLPSSFQDDDDDDDEGEDSGDTSKIRANPRYWAAFELLGEHR